MRLALAILGWYLVLVGALLCARPPLGKRLTDWWLKDKLSRPWALLPFGVGILLLAAAPGSRAPWLIRALGGLGALKGVYVLLAPRAHLTRVLHWWSRRSPAGYRWWGLLALLLGAALLAAR